MLLASPTKIPHGVGLQLNAGLLGNPHLHGRRLDRHPTLQQKVHPVFCEGSWHMLCAR